MNIFISACHEHCRKKNYYLPQSNSSSLRSHLKQKKKKERNKEKSLILSFSVTPTPWNKFLSYTRKFSRNNIVCLISAGAMLKKKPSQLETNDFTLGIMHSILKWALLIEIQEIDMSLKVVGRELIHFSIYLINHGPYRMKN